MTTMVHPDDFFVDTWRLVPEARAALALANGAYLGSCGGLPVVGRHTADGRRVAVAVDPDTGAAVGMLAVADTYPALRAACALWLDAAEPAAKVKNQPKEPAKVFIDASEDFSVDEVRIEGE